MIGIKRLSNDIHENERFKLSSLISEDNLLFGITRLRDNKLIGVKELRDLPNNFYLDKKYIQDLYQDVDIKDLKFNSISIAYTSLEFSIVPNPLIKDKDKNDLFSNSIKKYYNDYSIVKSNIENLDASIFFPFPNAVYEFAAKRFKNVSIQHIISPLIEQGYKLIKSNDFLIANINGYQLQTIVFKDNEFVQANIYNIKTKEDILYYILLNLKDNAIPLNIAEVYLSGRVDKESSIFTLLSEHIKNIIFINSIPRLDMSNIFLGKSNHEFFDIYSLSKCV